MRIVSWAVAVMVGSGCGDDGGREIGPPPGDATGSSGPTTTGEAITTTAATASTADPTATGPSSATDSSEGSTSTSGEPGSTGEGTPRVEPEIFRTPDEAEVCGPTPAAPCTPGDMGWLAAEYGSELSRADAGWVDTHGVVYRLVAMVERVGPSNIDVYVEDQDGAPLEGIAVAFYYDSLETPSRPDEWYPVKVEAITDVQGRAGFALGPGAYLDTCGGGGPHAIWVSEPGARARTTVASDLVDRLGMLGGTDHRHLDLLFRRVAPEQPLDPGHCPLQGA